jgi:hypothetical protein
MNVLTRLLKNWSNVKRLVKRLSQMLFKLGEKLIKPKLMLLVSKMFGNVCTLPRLR